MKTTTLCFMLLTSIFICAGEGKELDRSSLKKMSEAQLYEVGKSLTWKQAVSLAAKTSKTIQISKSALRSARHSKKSVQSSYYPSLRFSFDHQDHQKIAKTSTFFEPEPFETNRYGLRADMTIYDGSVREKRVELARENIHVSESQFKESQRLVMELVTMKYYEGVSLLSRIEQARKDLFFEKKNLELTRKRFAAGQSRRSEVLNFKLRANDVESTIIELEASWDILISELASLFAIDAKYLAGLEELEFKPLQNLQLEKMQNYVEQAYLNREDLKISESVYRQSQLNKAMVRGRYYPSLGVFADVSNSNRNSWNISSRGDAVLLGVSLSVNLFNGFKDHYDWLSLHEKELSAKLERENSFIRVKAEVESRFLNALKWLQVEKTLSKTVELARERRKLTQSEYQAGKIGVLQLNESQNQLSAIETRLRLASIRLTEAMIMLKVASGKEID